MTDSEKKIISQFVIGGLQNLCFAGLKGTDYGRCSGSSGFDCDNTLLANAIYVLLWGGEGNIFPKLTMDNVGTGKNFRGDTMNSFRSVLKSNKKPTVTPDKDIMDWVEKNAVYPQDKKDLPGTLSHWKQYGMEKKVMAFYRKYHTIGNFVVLPNRDDGNTTINLYRGKNRWHDFFDRFLIQLGNVLCDGGGKDPLLEELVNTNAFCLDRFRGEKGFQALERNLLLEDCCDNEYAPEIVFPMNYHWKNPSDPETYFRDAETYLDKAEKIISCRGRKMADVLQAKLAGE